jgi:hypothetical protein
MFFTAKAVYKHQKKTTTETTSLSFDVWETVLSMIDGFGDVCLLAPEGPKRTS